MWADASSEGWGAHCGDISTGGRWLTVEKILHINILEIKAIYFGLKTLCNGQTNIHVRVKSDNTTAVAYINNMGGIKSIACDEVVKELWEWCIERNIWVSAEHLPGVLNVIADTESRNFNDNTEWMLDRLVFTQVLNRFGQVEIDLFASRLNKQCDNFVSWRPDPDASFIDAFSCSWNNLKFYAFPPFSLVNKVLGKILRDQAEGILLVPLWMGQPWFPRLMKLLVDNPILLPLDVLNLPHKEGKHPLHKKLRILACRVSGSMLNARTYRQMLMNSSLHHGVIQQRRSIAAILKDGWLSVLEGKLIPITILKKQS